MNFSEFQRLVKRRTPWMGAAALAAAAVLVASCGGGGGGGGSTSLSNGGSGQTVAQQVAACEATLPALGTPSAGNAVPVIVDAGPCAYGVPPGSASGAKATVYILGQANIPYTTVTVCLPGTTTCQAIDHVLVDTGSFGLRIMSSVLNSNMAFTDVTANGGTVAECAQFADGYSWGKIHQADVKISGEVASNIPIHVIGDASSYTVPAGCTSGTPTPKPLNDVASFGANGVLGVGVFQQDCGSGCVGIANNGLYYTCPTTTNCVGYGPALANQVLNPVTNFTTDNNGVLLVMPAAGTTPGASVQNLRGQLIFGIGTAANNTPTVNSPSATVFTADYFGDFDSALVSSNSTYTLTTAPYNNSFIDSGSNGIYLPGTTIPTDTTSGWFIPASPAAPASGIVTIQGTMQSHLQDGTQTATGSPVAVSFDIANANTVLFTNANAANTAFDGLGAPNGSGISTGGIDWGFPFFMGRTVYVGLELRNATFTSSGSVVGPYWAY